MRAEPEIRTIRITLRGHEVAVLRRPPWQTAIDLGDRLEPSEVVATGFDGRGNLIARASQILNLPRPVAELEIVLRKVKERPEVVELLWHHREQARPKSAVLTFDGAPLRVAKNFSARLPRFDDQHPHVLGAELRFADGVVARSELVIEGGFSDSVGTQLTPIALNRTSPQESEALNGCLSVHGDPVRTSVAEKKDALVLIVKDPDPVEAERSLDPKRAMLRRGPKGEALKKELQLDPDTTARILWPVASQLKAPGEPATKLFLMAPDEAASAGGMRWLLTRTFARSAGPAPRQFADGVAVAGLRAFGSGRRRAVILLLSQTRDESNYAPAVVRRYVAAIGVPLFVWSLTGPRPDLADSWGPVDDISSPETLHKATDRLREALTAQRVAWVSLDPVTALHVEAAERCGVSPVARLGTE
jgi:hypothetical protein